MKNSKTERFILPRWIRLTADGQRLLHEEYLKAGDNKPSQEWIWFAAEIVDYREGCSRTCSQPDWRARVAMMLLWLVGKVLNRY